MVSMLPNLPKSIIKDSYYLNNLLIPNTIKNKMKKSKSYHGKEHKKGHLVPNYMI